MLVLVGLVVMLLHPQRGFWFEPQQRSFFSEFIYPYTLTSGPTLWRESVQNEIRDIFVICLRSTCIDLTVTVKMVFLSTCPTGQWHF